MLLPLVWVREAVDCDSLIKERKTTIKSTLYGSFMSTKAGKERTGRLCHLGGKLWYVRVGVEEGGGCLWKNSNVEYRKSMNHCVCHQPNSCSLKHRLWHINQSWQHFDGGSENKGSKWAWFYKNFQNLQYIFIVSKIFIISSKIWMNWLNSV